MSYAQTAGQFGSLGSGTAAGSQHAFETNNSGSGGGGGMGGMWGMIAQFAMQELDREKEDRASLFQGIKQAMNPNDYIMAHYPDFYSTPQVHTQAIANTNPVAPSKQAANMPGLTQGAQSNQGAMDRQQGSQEFERWKMEQEMINNEKNRNAMMQIHHQNVPDEENSYQEYLKAIGR